MEAMIALPKNMPGPEQPVVLFLPEAQSEPTNGEIVGYDAEGNELDRATVVVEP